jgi:2-methylcitrate dehydratase PrpD
MIQAAGKTISERLALYATGIKYEELPSRAIEKAKLSILDLLGAHFAGYDSEACHPVQQYISSLKATPRATVWSLGTQTSAAEAAFANSVVTHATIFDDMHTQSVFHFGSIVIPAAMAVAEEERCSGKELILAIVCGYDAGITVGASMLTPEFLKSGFRPSGTFGVFGSTVASGKLLGLTSDEMTRAIGLAANLAVGITAFGPAGTEDLIYHNGWAARNGILSSLLARNGAVSLQSIFEIDGGFCKAYRGNIEALEQAVSGLGEGCKIEEVYFKSAPACAFVQSTVQAALEIAGKKDFKIGDIKNVEARIFHLGKYYPGCDYAGPFNRLMQAQMSNQFAIASILVHGVMRFDHYVNFRDPSVQEVASKIVVNEDEEAESKWPEEQLVKLEVFLKDGSSRKAISRNPHFLNEGEVIEKSRYYLSRVLENGSCSQLIKTVQSLETLDDIKWLTQFFRKHIRIPKKKNRKSTNTKREK